MPEIFDNLDDQQLGTALKGSLAGCTTVDVATGYFDMRGWDSFKDLVEAKREAKAAGEGGDPVVRLLIGMVAPSDSETILESLQRDVQSPHGDVEQYHDMETAHARKDQLVKHLRNQLMRGLATKQGRATLETLRGQLADGLVQVKVFTEKPLHGKTGEVVYGNKPTDGGWLIVSPEDLEAVRSDPIAARFVRRYIGARELLHGVDRYCLWLPDITAQEAEESPVLRERLTGVQKFRLDSKAASTRAAASTPHLFRQISQPSTPYLCIPRHVSETRPFFLAARYAPEVITSDANFLAEDADGFVFAIISSSMFMTWQRTVGGRIKSDLRFNKLLTWNTFPLPHVSYELRDSIIQAGARVLREREEQANISLASQYDPSNISEALIEAHRGLDNEVDRAFGIDSRNATEADRQRTLFSSYLKLTSAQRKAER
ncbi:type IIL restriction-modification enzyme MmeI [Streptomyces sp. NPDC057148]|uniref:type IIL restriction-modification enzyme MmeI n=1 Tax=unclassified Streptomyces TaxID=2593676 RepID=UPI003636EDBE